MLTHKQVWEGIEQLAKRNNLSASGLAKRSGLDPTTFNKSKRTTKQGKARWPSTESISKILDATTTSMRDFVELMHVGDGRAARSVSQRLKCIRLADLEQGGGIDASGFPGEGPWEEIDFPLIEDDRAYVVELDRDLAAPIYRSGDLVVVSPSSSVRRGDRVLARRKTGELTLGLLVRRTAQRVVLDDVRDDQREQIIDSAELAWLARIVWLSQ